jgi:hypothetical protein
MPLAAAVKVGRAIELRVRQYRRLTPQKGIGILGQPQPHYYFHRPLRTLLGACFAAGMVLDGLEEPAFETPSADLARALHAARREVRIGGVPGALRSRGAALSQVLDSRVIGGIPSSFLTTNVS